jgi:galactan endo-beta-1,3-galactanase
MPCHQQGYFAYRIINTPTKRLLMKKFYLLFITLGLFATLIVQGKPRYNSRIPCHTQADSAGWETIIDHQSFASYPSFEKNWNYLYPWGSDHNGTARMYAGRNDHTYVSLQKGNVLCLLARPVKENEGNSNKHPFLPIRYHSGAIHAKHQVTVSDAWPVYEISAFIKAPVSKGTWPAFWLTAVHGWPPESDIVEFKGDSLNWQNTFITPVQVTTKKVAIPDAAEQWHHYKAILKKAGPADIDIYYYVDHKLTAVHRANFMNKPLWIIINLQMEGSAEGVGPSTDTHYYLRDVLVRRNKTTSKI